VSVAGSVSPVGPGESPDRSNKRRMRPSLSQQLAHIGCDENGGGGSGGGVSGGAEGGSRRGSNSSGGSGISTGISSVAGVGAGVNANSTSYFSQSLNSALSHATFAPIQSPTSVSLHTPSSSYTAKNAAPTPTTAPSTPLATTSKHITNTTTVNGTGVGNSSSGSTSHSTSTIESSHPNRIVCTLPAKGFTIGSIACHTPAKVMFYADRCEYPFHLPPPSTSDSHTSTPNSSHTANTPFPNTNANTTPINNSPRVDMVIRYADICTGTASAVGTKLRFSLPRRCMGGGGGVGGGVGAGGGMSGGGGGLLAGMGGERDGSPVQVVLELSSSACIAAVREKVMPLLQHNNPQQP
ncbi:hypothetical protein B484DRAFT_456077, partial [Ochromonadaceae sp. CCMP2298]